MITTDERPTWTEYEVRQHDMYGYFKLKYGVREEYTDGATRFIHNELVDTPEEAQLLASKFNMNTRKGKMYDNVMKSWN